MQSLPLLFATAWLAAALPALAGDDFHIDAEPGNHFTAIDYGARWPDGIVRWKYNPSGQPAGISTEQALATLQAAIANWQSGCALRFEYQGTTSAPVINQDGITAIGWGNANGYSGYTNIWWDGNKRITEADIVFNAATLTDTASLQAIASHELGHLMGFTHSDQPRSIMFSNPYHPLGYQTLPKGDDYAGCALLYGSAGVVGYSDLTTTAVQPGSGSVALFVSTSQPTGSRPSSSLSSLPGDFSGTAYFTAYFNGLPVGDTLKLRLVTPDGYAFYEYALTNKYAGSAYVYVTWDYASNLAMQRLPGGWQMQLLDQDRLIGKQTFTVASNYSVPSVPLLALLAGVNGDGSTSLSAQTLPAGQNESSYNWLLDQSSLGSGGGISARPGSGSHALWLLANSGNSRYTGSISGSSSQADGPDNGLFLDRLSDSAPTSARFSAVASGTKAAFSLDGQLQIAASGPQLIYVATVVGSTVYFKGPNGWTANPEPLLSASGPGWVAVNLFKRDDIRAFPSGLPIYAAYSSSFAELTKSGQIGVLYTLP